MALSNTISFFRAVTTKAPPGVPALTGAGLWAKWLGVLAVIGTVFAFSIPAAPFLHMDELVTVELGRTILHSGTDWSVTWMSGREQPAFLPFYLGPLLWEFSYQLMGQYGPRFFALAGALMAATLMVAWLLKRGVPANAAFLLGVVFLLDPLFVQAYTLGRVDGWTISLCLLSCLLLRRAALHPFCNRYATATVFCAGAVAALSFFVWPSAAFLAPLMVLELVSLLVRWKKENVLMALQPAVPFLLGALLMAGLLLLPLAPQLPLLMGNITEGMKINTRTGPLFGEQAGFAGRMSSFIELLRVLKFSPVLLFVTLYSFIRLRDKGLIIAALSATVLMLCTLVYIHRVLYLLPYFVAAAGSLFQPANTNSKPVSQSIKARSLLYLLIWAAGLSFCARTFLAISERSGGIRVWLEQTAKTKIGRANSSVLLLNTYEFYYAGRSLNWKMYAPYVSMGEALSPEKIEPLLHRVDRVVLLHWQLTDDLRRQLLRQGFRDGGWLHLYKDGTGSDDGRVSNMERLRSLYRIVPQPYGPYRLFVRDGKKEVA